MSLVVKQRKRQYEIPPEGTVEAILVEIKELGEVQTGFGAKEKLLFVWETDQTDKQGNSLKVFQRFTKSIHPQAYLTKAIRSITGDEPGDEFDLGNLIGVSVELVIQHNKGDDGITYANVAAIVRHKTAAEEASEKRVQSVIDAAKRVPMKVTNPLKDQSPITDADVPF